MSQRSAERYSKVPHSWSELMNFLRAKFFVLTRPLGHVAIQFLELDEPVHIFLIGSQPHHGVWRNAASWETVWHLVGLGLSLESLLLLKLWNVAPAHYNQPKKIATFSSKDQIIHMGTQYHLLGLVLEKAWKQGRVHKVQLLQMLGQEVEETRCGIALSR